MFGVDFVDLFSFLISLDYLSPFNICCKAGLMVLNSLNFCLSEKLFTSPSILNESLPGYGNLGCRFFPFSTLNVNGFNAPTERHRLAEWIQKQHIYAVYKKPTLDFKTHID